VAQEHIVVRDNGISWVSDNDDYAPFVRKKPIGKPLTRNDRWLSSLTRVVVYPVHEAGIVSLALLFGWRFFEVQTVRNEIVSMCYPNGASQ